MTRALELLEVGRTRVASARSLLLISVLTFLLILVSDVLVWWFVILLPVVMLVVVLFSVVGASYSDATFQRIATNSTYSKHQANPPSPPNRPAASLQLTILTVGVPEHA